MTSWVTTWWRAMLTVMAVDGAVVDGGFTYDFAIDVSVNPESGTCDRITITVRPKDVEWFTNAIVHQLSVCGWLEVVGIDHGRHDYVSVIVLDVSDDDELYERYRGRVGHLPRSVGADVGLTSEPGGCSSDAVVDGARR
jgi:hypothetical protein